MKIACFLDTNILIYAARGRQDDPDKFTIASDLVETMDFGLSGQVLAEFCSVAGRIGRDGRHIPAAEVDRWLVLLGEYPTVPIDAAIVQRGVALSRRYQITYYDGAILAAAERLGAPVVYTEDLNHGQAYGDVRVINPFTTN